MAHATGLRADLSAHRSPRRSANPLALPLALHPGFHSAALSATLATALLAGTAPTQAAELGIASFNLAWAGTAADFERHLAVCGAPTVNWCDSRPRIPRGATEAPTTEVQRAEQCQAAFTQAAGGPAAAMLLAPCNAYRLNAPKLAALGTTGAIAQHEEKLQGLRQTVAALVETDRVDVIAFQEVKSVEAIRVLLGPHAAAFEACVAPHNAFQTIGFAWRTGVSSTPALCTAEAALAVAENPQDPANPRRVRPGLALRLTVGGTPVTVMNVHLKSSCANWVATERYAARELTDPNAHCQVLNRQVAPLEQWVEAVAAQTPMFVLLGDFNRRLDEEAALSIAAHQVRTDGSDPASPHRPGPDGRVTSRLLWQELSDGQPGLAQVPLAGTDAACTGFTGLDHILLSTALAARQPAGLGSAKRAVVQQPQQPIISSDHCPRVVRLAL